ncbi:hypothetical protein GGR50DRAFT_366507 [Xylaria sp. CBS 124048]|nr:hypothetical protein GGR50DRAFT_366507 [Xylaria sp. CBS 124048]
MKYGMSYHAAVAACAFLPLVTAVANIVTFADDHCGKFLSTIDAPESASSGVCQHITSKYQSFMVTHLPDECSLTIYGNVPFCSSPQLELGKLNTCYNTSWAFYSVDDCLDLPSSSPPHKPTLLPTTSSTTTHTTATTLHTSTTSSSSPIVAAPSTPAALPTVVLPPPSAEKASDDSQNVGAIAGGTVGGVAIVACLVLYFFAYRPSNRQQFSAPPPHHGAELPSATTVMPLPVKKAHPYSELSEPPTYELSPQYVAEVHADTVHRHELAS